jgi:hypothetical protein
MSERIGAELESVKACPEPCYDGSVRIVTAASDRDLRVACPLVRWDCAYGLRLRIELDRYLEKTMSRLGVPRRHLENFGGIRESVALAEALKWPVRGFLVLCGKPGVGKSFAAACVVREFLKRRITNRMDRKTWEAADRAGDSVMWSGAKEITDDKGAFVRARSAFLLVLDDLGKEEDTQTGRAAACAVISKRYDAMLATAVTTELPMSGLRIRYGSYLTERLAEDAGRGGSVVDCGDVSMRLSCVTGSRSRVYGQEGYV